MEAAGKRRDKMADTKREGERGRRGKSRELEEIAQKDRKGEVGWRNMSAGMLDSNKGQRTTTIRMDNFIMSALGVCLNFLVTGHKV